MKKDILDLDKVSKEELFDELEKGMEDIMAGNIVSMEQARATIRERYYNE